MNVPGKSANGAAERRTVGVGDMIVVRSLAGLIITHALGSCIGVCVFDPIAGVAGLLHFMLPQPTPGSTPDNESMYGSTGIPKLFRAAYELGAEKKRMIVCAAGGAELIRGDGQLNRFQIGDRNRNILRKLFWKNDIVLSAQDVGGSVPRTLSLHLPSGEVRIRTPQAERALWSPHAPNGPNGPSGQGRRS